MQHSEQDIDVSDALLHAETPMENRSAGRPSAEETDKQRTFTCITYGVYTLGLLVGLLPAIAALIMAYIKRNEYQPTYSQHLNYLISTFWWSLVWMVIGAITAFLFVGLFIIVAACIWTLYRLIRGFILLYDGKPPHTVKA